MVQLQKEARIKLTPSRDYLIMARIRLVIRKSGYSVLSQIRVVVREGEVYLEGKVPTYFLKQMAQTLILPVEGVKALKNELSVDACYNKSA